MERKLQQLKDYKKYGLSNIELQNLADEYLPRKKKKVFLGIVARDELPSINEIPQGKSFGLIINTSGSSNHNKNEGHWVAVYVDPRAPNYEINYYDSYGEKAPVFVKRWLDRIVPQLGADKMLKFKWNNVIDQHANSVNCGWFALKFLHDRFLGRKFKDCSHYNECVNNQKKNNVRAGENMINRYKLGKEKKIIFNTFY